MSDNTQQRRQEIEQGVEAIVLDLVAEGRAEFWGCGPEGPILAAPPGEVVERARERGLLGNPVALGLTLGKLKELPEEQDER